MNAAELRKKTDEELRRELLDLAQKRFSLRMAMASSQERLTHRPGMMRRDMARIKTILHERHERDAATAQLTSIQSASAQVEADKK